MFPLATALSFVYSHIFDHGVSRVLERERVGFRFERPRLWKRGLLAPFAMTISRDR
jgi:hypothetical protein